MRLRIAIVYNEPVSSYYDAAGEEKAVLGVLNAVVAVHQSLLECGYDVTRIPLKPPPEQAIKILNSLDANLVFNLFEGFCGYPETEALVPEVLSKKGTLYTGCPGSTLRLALDKAKTKIIMQAAGIPTPDFQLLNPQTLHTFQLQYPCIVKPRSEDASHGLTELSVVNNLTALKKQVKLVSRSYAGGAIVEEFIDGCEFNVTLLGNSQCTVLPVSEITYSLPPEMPRLLNFAAKWEADSPYFQGTRAVCPAEIETKERERITRTATDVFRLLGCQGYARVDFRLDSEERFNVIEVNPNPDISPGSGAARQAEAAGMTYTRFIEKIVQLALEKEYHEHQYSPHAQTGQASPDENTARYARIQAL